ncbi:MAG: divalent-cation tolerance protein CutA [Candidatus Omnitrophica bacterium]|nr:divalent-cation tolerance protein CutA [Candidatus Omnitrophota bacterium]MCM8793040.1 divalent-cation tolerance protein CutA [Candidatus Omnitrophota bacterium]
MKDYLVVLITVPNKKEAGKIARILVEKKLVACINIVPEITSIYHWQGKIEKSKELLLLIKSKKNLFRRLLEEVKKIHSYTVPEIIALNIEKGYKPYLDWIGNSVRQISGK